MAKAQINILVTPTLREFYGRAKRRGHGVSRYAAAGLLLLLERPAARRLAMRRLEAWELRDETALEAALEKLR